MSNNIQDTGPAATSPQTGPAAAQDESSRSGMKVDVLFPGVDEEASERIGRRILATAGKSLQTNIDRGDLAGAVMILVTSTGVVFTQTFLQNENGEGVDRNRAAVFNQSAAFGCVRGATRVALEMEKMAMDNLRNALTRKLE